MISGPSLKIPLITPYLTGSQDMDQISQPAISVIIVNYNAGRLISDCIQGLREQTFQDFSVLVVDNASTDGSFEALEKHEDWIELHKNKQNMGFAAANNQAARIARGRWLATLNPDTYPRPDWLERLMQAVDRHPGTACFGSTLIDAVDPTVLDGAGDPYHAFGFAWRGAKGHPIARIPGEGSVFGPCAAAALYRRDLFLELGGFYERFFCYYEDVDLAFRIRLAGGACVQVPDAQVTHVGSAISGAQSEFSVYHITRNRIWTFYKNMPAALLTLLSLPMLGVLGYSLIRRPSRARWRALGAAFAGIGPVIRDRNAENKRRIVGAVQMARALTWTLKVSRLEADVRYRPREAATVCLSDVCALVVTYHGEGKIREGLEALLAEVEQIVVVDNGSDEHTLATLRGIKREYPGRIELILNSENLGLARAQNQAIEHAQALGYRWFLFMDQDSVPRKGMVTGLLRAYNTELRERPVAVVAPAVVREGMVREQSYMISDHAFHLRRKGFGGRGVLHNLAFVIASGSLVSADVLQEIGPLREDFFIDYVDVEFCLRARERGYDILAVREAELFHRLGETQERRLGLRTVAVTHHKAQRRYYIYRNRSRLWRSYVFRRPAWVGFDLLAALQEVLKILVHEENRREKLRSVLQGLRDGIWGPGLRA